MHIRHVLNYGNSWNKLTEEYPEQYSDITRVVTKLSDVDHKNIAIAEPYEGPEHIKAARKFEAFWIERLKDEQWQMPMRRKAEGPFRVRMRSIGQVKREVSVRFIRHREVLNDWLYTSAPMAVRSGLVNLPIAVTFLEEAQLKIFGRAFISGNRIFDELRDNLLALSPLSHASPFLVIALASDYGNLEITHLDKEEGVSFRQVVVNRSIEFPPQYHQAGLGVLTYFGTVLREKYPNRDVKVRIEQNGLNVRLIIESENGDREIIERALQEYELVVRGEKAPQDFLPSTAAVVELKNELRIAQVRIESQRDIINLQEDQITSLRQLIGNSLTRAPQSIDVSISPVIRVSTDISQLTNANTCIPELSEDIRELIALPIEDVIKTRLLDLTESLEFTSVKTSAEEVGKSSGLEKLRKFLEEASTAGSKANDAIKKIDDALVLVQGLGRKYNAVAEWCGAPQIPRIFLNGGK